MKGSAEGIHKAVAAGTQTILTGEGRVHSTRRSKGRGLHAESSTVVLKGKRSGNFILLSTNWFFPENWIANNPVCKTTRKKQKNKNKNQHQPNS